MVKTIRRRRKEGKTDYAARLIFLKSQKPRLVVRKTNRYLVAQIVQSDIAQDNVLFGVTSKDLLAKGWPKDKHGSLKSLSAAYLTGYMLGKMAKAKISGVIFDIGMHRNIAGSRIYAVLQGAIDAGLTIPHSKEALPSPERIAKTPTGNLIEKIKGTL